jgi:hypothetical protein
MPWFTVSSLKAVPTFKKGALVEIIGPAQRGSVSEIGLRFVIKETGEDLSVDMGDEYKDCYSAPCMFPYKASSLRLVEELKIGDYAMVIGPNSLTKNENIGAVFRIIDSNEHSGNMGSLNGSWYPTKSLRKLTPEEVLQHIKPQIMPVDLNERLTSVESATFKLDLWKRDVNARLSAIEKKLKQLDGENGKFLADYREGLIREDDQNIRLSAIESCFKDEMPEVCEDEPYTESIHITILGNRHHTNVFNCTEDTMRWYKVVLDSMRKL